MLLVIDVGNTSIHYGVMESAQRVVSQFRCQLNVNRTSDEYAILINEQLRAKKIDCEMIDGVIICSVVPKTEDELLKTCNSIFKGRVFTVKPKIKTGLSIRIDDPTELGADLLAAAVGALSIYKGPIILVDLGTATTISYIDEQANFQGGLIMPGLRLCHDALVKGAAKVHDVLLEAPKQLIGKSTETAIQSGLIFGHAAMLDELFVQIKNEKKCNPTIIITGGLSDSVRPCLKTKVIYDPELIFKGLYTIYQKNI